MCHCLINIELMCNGLKNKAYYLFDKGGDKKDGYVMGAKMRPCIAYATTWGKNETSGVVAIDLSSRKALKVKERILNTLSILPYPGARTAPPALSG